MHRPDDYGVRNDPDHNRRNTVEQIDNVLQYKGEEFPAVLGKVDASQETDRDADCSSQEEYLTASHDGISHSSSSLSGRFRKLGKEVKIKRTSAMPKQVAEDKKQNRNDNERTHA